MSAPRRGLLVRLTGLIVGLVVVRAIVRTIARALEAPAPVVEPVAVREAAVVPPPPAVCAPVREPERVNIRGVLWFIGALVASIVAVLVAAGALEAAFEPEDASPRGTLWSATLPPGDYRPGASPEHPLHWALPAADLEATRARWKAELGAYGWVDRERGVARIPLDVALELLAGGRDPRELLGPEAPR